MTITIPSAEPTSLVRGDSAHWYVEDTEYPPADGWTMRYFLVNKDSTRVSFAGFTDNGDGRYLVTVTKSETNGLLAGRWNWQRVATRTTEQVTRDSGDLVVIDGFASNASAVPFVDGRSWARQALDEIEAAILARASTGQTSASFNGRSVSWQSLAELYQIRSDLKAETAAEDDAENAGLGRQIRVRYGN